MNAIVRAPVYWLGATLLCLAWTACSLGVQEQGDDEAYTFKATYQIQKGTRNGRIVIHVDMPKTWHTYSLSQPNPPGNTEIVVKKSDDFKITGEFSADHEPKVTDNDPIFGRLEEFYDEVSFVAPIQVDPAAGLDKLKFDLKISCQICSESTCEFIKNRALEVEFDGYYEPKPPDKKTTSPKESATAKKTPRK